MMDYVSGRPLDDYVRVCIQTGKNANGDGDDAMAVTQYDMTCLVDAGLKLGYLALQERDPELDSSLVQQILGLSSQGLRSMRAGLALGHVCSLLTIWV